MTSHAIHAKWTLTLSFLERIGITVRYSPVPALTGEFLDGVTIERGCQIAFSEYEDDVLGNLLHEAGHLAVIPSAFRSHIFGDVDLSLMPLADAYIGSHPFLLETPSGPTEDPIIRGILQAGDQEAMAWSYAAALYIGVDPRLIFNDSIQNGLSDILFGLSQRRHAGIHGLQAAGMTSVRTFPEMKRWTQL